MIELIANVFVLHAGTPLVLSQTVLTLMFVVLGILLVGVGFGFAVKNKDSLRQHRYALTIALVLTLIPALSVMIPTMYRFYTDPDVMVFSSISVTQMLHAAVSIPALATASIYAFGKLPGNVKKGMRWTVALWIAAMVLGVLIFLQMTDLIPSF